MAEDLFPHLKWAQLLALVDALYSKEIQDWIRTKYKGAVIPVNN